MIRYLDSWIIHISNMICLTGTEYFYPGMGGTAKDRLMKDEGMEWCTLGLGWACHG